MFRTPEPRGFTQLLAACGLAILVGSSGCCFTGACRTSGIPMAGGCNSGACDAGGGAMFPGSCGTCTGGSCGGLGSLALPLLSSRLACGSGCGGVYWNEWVSDPPDCCDPCNDCGCWVGPRCESAAYPYGSGILSGGPIGVVRGAVRGVTGFVGNVIHTGVYGYPGSGGSCIDGSCGTMMEGAIIDGGYSTSGGCSDCGTSGCAGGCAANITGAVPTVVTHAPVPQVRRTAAEAVVGGGIEHAKPPHRVVTKRLRR